jgi:hypothetical protein
MTMQTFEGGCHCGRVRFRATADLATASVCNCSICTKKGILHVVVPQERFELLSGKDDIATYEFGTGVAKHHFCRHCGIHSFYVPRSYPDRFSINLRCIDGVDPADMQVDRTFDGRNWEEAMRKRASEDAARGGPR